MPFIFLDVPAKCVCTIQDAGIDLCKSHLVVREATNLRPPTRFADGGDHAQDHACDDLGLQDHDHVGAFDLGDRRDGGHTSCSPSPPQLAQ